MCPARDCTMLPPKQIGAILKRCSQEHCLLRRTACLLVIFLCFLFELADGCRWALYAGEQETDASSLFSTPSHSLLRQSYSAPYLPDIDAAMCFDPEKNLVRNHEVNQDGWGVGWFEHREGRRKARRVRSGKGATRNLAGLPDPDLEELIGSRNISSNVIFGHIRAATDGDLNPVNSHPFQYNVILWMHNGGVANKTKVMQQTTCGDVDLVHGETDSEYAGAMFVSFLEGNVCSRSTFELRELEDAMRQTIQTIQADDRCDGGGRSSLNFAATDGTHVVVTRYRTCPHEEPPSLYYAVEDHKLWCSSEPLDDIRTDGRSTSRNGAEQRRWRLLAKDQMLSYSTESGALTLQCLSDACEGELHHRQTRELERFWRAIASDFLGDGLGDDQCETPP